MIFLYLLVLLIVVSIFFYIKSNSFYKDKLVYNYYNNNIFVDSKDNYLLVTNISSHIRKETVITFVELYPCLQVKLRMLPVSELSDYKKVLDIDYINIIYGNIISHDKFIEIETLRNVDIISYNRQKGLVTFMYENDSDYSCEMDIFNFIKICKLRG